MGFLSKVRRTLEHGTEYLGQIDAKITHGNERLEAYQAKWNEKIDAFQAGDLAALQTEVRSLRDEIAALRAQLAALDLED